MEVCSKENNNIACSPFSQSVQNNIKDHYCVGAAYETGYQSGLSRGQAKQDYLMDLDEGQLSLQGQKSPIVAFAQGYLKGVSETDKILERT